MQYHLVDRIIRIEPGRRIVTVKALSLAEEYLADHFPAFPVLPGVLMVEALVQSAAWLVRCAQDWARSIIVLGVARNVRYANFVQPGRVLECDVQARSIEADAAQVQATGTVDGATAVSGRLELRCFNLAERAGTPTDADQRILADLRKRFELIGGPAALAAAASA